MSIEAPRSGGSHSWMCPEHGRIADVLAGDRCPQCGLTALDADNPANRDAIDFAYDAGQRRHFRDWHPAVMALAVVGLPFAGVLVTDNPITWLPLIATLLLAAVVLFAMRQRAGWREPGRAFRMLTSTTMFAIVVCLLFAGIKHAVGIEALWYAAGDPVWRVATATFTHGSAMHLIGNLIGFAMFGFAVDRRVGRFGMLVIIGVTALTAVIPQSQLIPGPMVGFSGVVYGVFGATLALMPTRLQLLQLQAIVIPIPTWGWMLVVVTAYTVVDALDPARHVAWIAHLSGFFGGLLIALPMRAIKPGAAYLAEEDRRRGRIASLARESGFDDLVPSSEQAEAASSNPEIAAYHRAARRKRVVITVAGGLLMAVLGLAASGLAAYLEAPAFAGSRRVTVIVVGLVMFVIGLGMAGAAIVRRR